MRFHDFLHRGLPALVTLGLALALGCSSDDNPAGGDDGHHLEAVGVALVHGGDTLSMAVGAVAPADEFHVYEGESLGPILVHFLDEEGHWFRPDADAGEEHALEVLHNQLLVALEMHDDWSFTLSGVNEGETELIVKVLHEGHADYVSPGLPLHVEHSDGVHGEPVGMRLVSGEMTLAESFADGSVVGHVELVAGGQVEFETWFLDDEGTAFQPDEDHALAVDVAGSALVALAGEQIEPGTSPWRVRLEGLAAGSAQLVFRVLHDDHSHFVSPAIDALVVAP